MVKATNKAATQGLKPDLTVLLDIAVEKGLARKLARKQDRFEQEASIFHHRVKEGYLKLAAAEPRRWLVIDASRSRQEVADIIWQRVSRLISKRRG